MNESLHVCRNETRARVGMFGVGHNTYWAQFEGLLDEMGHKMEVLKGHVAAGGVEVVSFGVVDDAISAAAILPRIQAADLDLLMINMVTYATSAIFGVIAKAVKIPIVLVALQPLSAMDYPNGTTYMQLCNDDFCAVPEFIGVAVRMGLPPPPMILASYSAYTQGKEQTKLRFVSIKEPPVLVDNAVQWTMVLDYGVERSIRIELGKDELRLSHTQTKGSVPAPDSILHAISVNFPAVVEFDVESRMYKGPALPQGVSQAGLKTALQGHQLLMRTDGSRRSTLYPFSDITPTPYIGMVDAAEVKGMYAPFRIEYTDAEKTATSGFYSYGGQPPSSGFKISHSKIDAAAPLATGVFSLSIRR